MRLRLQFQSNIKPICDYFQCLFWWILINIGPVLSACVFFIQYYTIYINLYTYIYSIFWHFTDKSNVRLKKGQYALCKFLLKRVTIVFNNSFNREMYKIYKKNSIILMLSCSSRNCELPELVTGSKVALWTGSLKSQKSKTCCSNRFFGWATRVRKYKSVLTKITKQPIDLILKKYWPTQKKTKITNQQRFPCQ